MSAGTELGLVLLGFVAFTVVCCAIWDPVYNAFTELMAMVSCFALCFGVVTMVAPNTWVKGDSLKASVAQIVHPRHGGRVGIVSQKAGNGYPGFCEVQYQDGFKEKCNGTNNQ